VESQIQGKLSKLLRHKELLSKQTQELEQLLLEIEAPLRSR
jgi:hypothetical protein